MSDTMSGAKAATMSDPKPGPEKKCKACGKPVSVRRELCVKCANEAAAKTLDLGGTVKPPNTKDSREARQAGSDFENWLAVAQLMLLSSGDEYCATLLNDCGPPIVQSMTKICEDFPMIRKLISGSDKWAAVAALIFQVSKLSVGIAVHHGALQYSKPIAVLGIRNPNADAQSVHST